MTEHRLLVVVCDSQPDEVDSIAVYVEAKDTKTAIEKAMKAIKREFKHD